MTADQVLVLKEAAADLAEGVDFYESQKSGLGVYYFVWVWNRFLPPTPFGR